MDGDSYKIVRFDKYCSTCTHKDTKDDEEPCDACLDEPINLYSEKPVKYTEK